MNSLGRDIKEGEIVVLKKKIFIPEYQELKYRLFRVLDGFGMYENTMGSRIVGSFLSDGGDAAFDAMDIDPKETEKYQLEA